MSLTIRALLLIWPFLWRALFGDLTVKEVVLVNLHITVVYICLCILIYMQLYTVVELSVVKSEKSTAIEAVCVKPDDVKEADTLLIRRRLFGDILK